MRVAYERSADPRDLLRRARDLSARTIILDVEPLVACWDSGQEALDAGIAHVLGQIAVGPGLLVVCFATNSGRRPSAASLASASPASASGAGVSRGDASGDRGPRVVYLASAGKPLRTAPYRGFPRPGVVIGDQTATDGILAWRLGYAFLHYRPDLAHVPSGPRLMGELGRPLQPLLFTRPR